MTFIPFPYHIAQRYEQRYPMFVQFLESVVSVGNEFSAFVWHCQYIFIYFP